MSASLKVSIILTVASAHCVLPYSGPGILLLCDTTTRSGWSLSVRAIVILRHSSHSLYSRCRVVLNSFRSASEHADLVQDTIFRSCFLAYWSSAGSHC